LHHQHDLPLKVARVPHVLLPHLCFSHLLLMGSFAVSQLWGSVHKWVRDGSGFRGRAFVFSELLGSSGNFIFLAELEG
ncbi:MAG TPA: hypothetical protein VEF06_06910, partial [Bryobacteraceae bacterium]|nr:hypothetical protein [Bryobacteraceae bacterium]